MAKIIHAVRKLDKQFVVRVTVKKSLVRRVWLGVQFIRFGAWIADLGFVIEDASKERIPRSLKQA